jgi:steroid 5-alpha reductase family enzyme
MTGVALTERTIVATRPAYRDYQRRTSAFIPWFPKEPDHEPSA